MPEEIHASISLSYDDIYKLLNGARTRSSGDSVKAALLYDYLIV